MKKLRTQIQKILKQIREIKWNFTSILIVIIVVILILIVLNTLLFNNGMLETSREEGDVVVITRPTLTGELIFKYKIINVGENKILKIYVNDLSDQLLVNQIINVVLLQENLKFDDVLMDLEEIENLATVDINELISDEANVIDPTNLSYLITRDPNDPSLMQFEDTFENVDFRLYVDTTQIATENFNIFKIDVNNYQVRLKGGYTRQQFERDFLSKFQNTSDIHFEYINKDDFWLETP